MCFYLYFNQNKTTIYFRYIIRVIHLSSFILILAFWCISIEEEPSKLLQTIKTSNLCVKHRIYSNMEIIIDFLNLSQVFILHLSSGTTFITRRSWIWENYLIYNNILNINFLFGQFNSETFSFVHTEEFWDANSNECCLLWVLKLRINFINFLFNSVKGIIHFLM